MIFPEPPSQTARLTLDQALQQAITLHRQGQLQEAERYYRSILLAQPDHADANHNLGVLVMQLKRPATALPHFKSALATNPAQEQYWLSYIDALIQTGHLETAQQVFAQGKQRGLRGDAVDRLQQTLRAQQPKPSPEEINTLLTLYHQGDYAAAATLARTMTLRFPMHGLGWHLLGLTFRLAGQNESALAPLQTAAARSPDDAEVHFNLAALFHDLGRNEEAVLGYRRALEIKPDFAGAHNNLGNSLGMLGRHEEAMGCYRQALNIQPDFADAHNNLAQTLNALGHPKQALPSLHRTLQIKPDFAEAHCNLGNVYRNLGQRTEAEACYRRALQLRPGFVEALNNLGNVLRLDPQRCGEAEACYRQALQLQADFVEVLNNLAVLLNEPGRFVEALPIIRQSLRIKESARNRKIFVASVKHLRLTPDSEMRMTMLRAISAPWGRPSDLAPAVTHLVKLNPHIAACIARAVASWPRRISAQALFGSHELPAEVPEPLLIALLESAPIGDIGMERFLTLARHTLLDDAAHMTISAPDAFVAPPDFYCALARQCFINEYVFACTDDETHRANSIRDRLITALDAGTRVPPLWLLAVAAYFPLGTLSHAARLLDSQWSEEINALLTQQISEAEEEHCLRADIPRLGEISNDSSLRVQQQYEQHPFPRWIKSAPAGDAQYIDAYLSRQFPLATFKRLGKTETIDILIAGCGTGQQAIETARLFRDARVLAIDLSLSSLSYAKRKTHESGLNSIEYAQADILQLGSLDRRFDLIESSGVLHHLADPWLGWRVLLGLLRPGGFMKLGFYSALARRDIVRARDFIAQQGYGSSANEIRRCRQNLLSSTQSADFASVIKSPDFFSTSNCRDLLFHVQEQHMSLGGIAAFLRDNKLNLLGLEVEPTILHAYLRRFPDDPAGINLDQWQLFENEHPDTFLGMYQFWVQKSV